jgi:mannose-6-phosphate isomerase
MNTKKFNHINDVKGFIEKIIYNDNFHPAEYDMQRPWGGFIRLKNSDAEKFIDLYFANIKGQFASFENLSPKYLLVAPGQQLSWQYHYRRAEHWKVLEGKVGVKLSDSDNLPEETTTLQEGEMVQFPAEKRHRLIGLDDWGVVVEIWEHVAEEPSDEDDIVRLQDNYGR